MGGSFGWVTGDRGWSEVAGGGVGILGKVRCPLTECKLSMNVQTTIEFLKLILAVPCYYFRSWGKQAELSCTWVILCWMTSIVRVSSFHQFLNLVLQVTLGLSASIGGYDASQRAFRLSSSPSMCEYRSSLCYVAGMVSSEPGNPVRIVWMQCWSSASCLLQAGEGLSCRTIIIDNLRLDCR